MTENIKKLSLAERVVRALDEYSVLFDDQTPDGDPFHDMVYKFCHIAAGTCGNKHEDWLAEFEGLEADIAEFNSQFEKGKEK